MGLAILRGGTGEAIRRRDGVGVHTTEDIDMREKTRRGLELPCQSCSRVVSRQIVYETEIPGSSISPAAIGFLQGPVIEDSQWFRRYCCDVSCGDD